MYTINTKINKQLSIWLITMFWIISIMIIVGGLTRLTDSGLSITKWQLFSGLLPPLNENDWISYFDLYKEIPEFKLQNFNNQYKLNQTYLKVYNAARKNGSNPREAMDKATLATKFSNNETISKKCNHNITDPEDLLRAYRLRTPNILGIANVNMNCSDYLETLRNL